MPGLTLQMGGGYTVEVFANGYTVHLPSGGFMRVSPNGLTTNAEGLNTEMAVGTKLITDNLLSLWSLVNTKVLNLRRLDWRFTGDGSTGGVLYKARAGNTFYKCSAFSETSGFYGQEAVTEAVVSSLLDSMGVEHLHYDVAPAMVRIKGKDYCTPVCISQNYNTDNLPVCTIGRYFDSPPTDEELDACGMLHYVQVMRVVDFMIGNLDRHNANVEIVAGKPVPLFDNGCSLVMLNDPATWTHWSRDTAQTCCGTNSLKQNLLTVPSDVLREIHAPLLDALDTPYWTGEYIEACKRMVRERWDFVKGLI